MTILTDITRVAPRSEALIRIYPNGSVTLNARASELLGLEERSCVSFRTDGRLVYVSKKPYAAYAVHMRGKTCRVRSTDLARSLAESLQGYGAYRIEYENPEKDFDGDPAYPIFFKKYLQ